ncbi:hypothetical protein SCHPADRAFT_619124 [Schizopora paradoxa]|uniref:Uncharacterized protein n=1 Tax=Schizopora paradoxa TaxID=27342 RepID=A0A0H2R9T5_9AGAM|nr:hypothetical protein SCHPADRAFT_619124 [Schizopora paradoxa]
MRTRARLFSLKKERRCGEDRKTSVWLPVVAILSLASVALPGLGSRTGAPFERNQKVSSVLLLLIPVTRSDQYLLAKHAVGPSASNNRAAIAPIDPCLRCSKATIRDDELFLSPYTRHLTWFLSQGCICLGSLPEAPLPRS